MQQPTCTNLRIRSTADAHKIFAAVQQGILHMVARRLDADERIALRSGCVYAWEERGPHSELTGLGIERFTEGRRWSPSRVRDEFLFYYEKYNPAPDSSNAGSYDRQPPRDWDPLVKQTYSVWVETDKGKRKWHLTAYFTQATIDHLGSIEDHPRIRDIVVAPGMFKSTRVGKSRGKADDPNRSDAARAASSASRTYAAFPTPYQYQNGSPNMTPVLMHEPYKSSRPPESSSPYEHSPSPVSPQDDGYSAHQRVYSSMSSSPPVTYSDHGFSSLTQAIGSPSPGRYPVGMRPPGLLSEVRSLSRSPSSAWQNQPPEYQQRARYDREMEDSKPLLLSQASSPSAAYGAGPSHQHSMQPLVPENSYTQNQILSPQPLNSHNTNLYTQSYGLQLTPNPMSPQLPDMHTYPLSPLQIPDTSMHSTPFIQHNTAAGLTLQHHQESDYIMGGGMEEQHDTSQDGGLVPLEVLRRPIRYPRDPVDERTLRMLREQGTSL